MPCTFVTWHFCYSPARMKKYAIIVAGGKGQRMGADTPKQFLLLKGKPVLMHTVGAFSDADKTIELILVLPEEHINTWKELCRNHRFEIRHKVVAGGAQRTDSVKNGLKEIDEPDALVAIHDGVRPLIDSRIINESFTVALSRGNAVAAVKLKDSLRQETREGNKAVNRDEFYLIQTPQTFQKKLITGAYQNCSETGFTDDASVLESTGKTINLIQGDYRNIKITTPEDLILAEAFLSN